VIACSRCGSFAINHHLHGRDGSYKSMCDVCYWRTKEETVQSQLKFLQARVRDLEDMLEDGSVIPRQPELEGGP
jgi:hypothetical protein